MGRPTSAGTLSFFAVADGDVGGLCGACWSERQAELVGTQGGSACAPAVDRRRLPRLMQRTIAAGGAGGDATAAAGAADRRPADR